MFACVSACLNVVFDLVRLCVCVVCACGSVCLRVCVLESGWCVVVLCAWYMILRFVVVCVCCVPFVFLN